MKKKVSPEVKEIISHSKKGALLLGYDHINTQHLLLSIVRASDSFAIRVFTSLGVNTKYIIKIIAENISQDEATTAHSERDQLPLNEYAEKALKTMSLEAQMLKDEQVRLEHLVMAILKHPESIGAKVLRNLNVDYDRYKLEVVYLRNETQRAATEDSLKYDDDEDNMRADAFGSKSSQQRKDNPKSKTPVTDNFGRDITKFVNQNRQYATIERDAEIQLIAQMLSKKEKNNVLLIGKSGVGKRAIIEEFTYRIQTNSVYARYFNRVVELDWAVLMMDAKHRGDLEERIRAILDELSRFPKTIILLNQIHIACQFTGKGLFISDILKPVLEYNQFKFIGVTTPEKYHLIATDHTMNSYFRKLFIEPTSPEQTVRILENIKSEYEEFHKVIYEKDTIETCVQLTHLRGGILPGKAVDLLDEIAAQVRINKMNVPNDIVELRQEIRAIKDKKNQAVKMQRYEEAADIWEEEIPLTAKLDSKERLWMEEFDSKPLTVSKQDVEKAFQSIKKFRQP